MTRETMFILHNVLRVKNVNTFYKNNNYKSFYCFNFAVNKYLLHNMKTIMSYA